MAFLHTLGITAALMLVSLALASPTPAQSPTAAPTRCELLLTPNFTMHEVVKGIFQLEFENQRELTSTFMRFQEHYESPEFRGRIFSRTEYKKWYRKTKGAFTYFKDWAGFNIPSTTMKPFADGHFKRLNRRERTLMEAFRDKDGLFYVIGTYKSDSPHTLNHEIAHGMFFTNAEYRREMLAQLETIDLTEIDKFLASSGGYHPSVWLDEAQAYLINNGDSLEHHGIDLKPFAETIARMQAIFQRHYANQTSGLAASAP